MAGSDFLAKCYCMSAVGFYVAVIRENIRKQGEMEKGKLEFVFK